MAALLCSVSLAGEVVGQSFSRTFERAFPQLSFEAPVALRADPSGSGWLFIISQKGMLYTFPESDGANHAHLVLDIGERVLGPGVDSESGLIGLALHPQFADNGYIYLHYLTNITGGPTARISRFTTIGSPAVADVDSEMILIEHERDHLKHNGGDLHFSSDGFLFASFGDGFCCGDPAGHGQDKTTLFSTIIRIDVDNPQGGLPYGIPADNPFVGNSEGWREEIWAYGLRNPWRFSIHPETGEIWVGDVGELTFEEVNRIVRGGNYGWNIMEGPDCFEWPPGSGQGTNCDPSGLIPPVWYYGRDRGISITGGYFYRGGRRPDLHGRYIFADWGARNVFFGEADSQAQKFVSVQKIVAEDGPFASAFGEGTGGELYVLGYFSGNLYRLRQPEPGLAPQGRIYIDGPNPTTAVTHFQVETLQIAQVTIAVYDAIGRRTLVPFQSGWLSPSAFGVTLDVKGLASGAYLVALIMDGQLVDTARFTVLGRR